MQEYKRARRTTVENLVICWLIKLARPDEERRRAAVNQPEAMIEIAADKAYHRLS